MAKDLNIEVIDYFAVAGHAIRLFEITHPDYGNPRYIFTDEALAPIEFVRGDGNIGYELDTKVVYTSKPYTDKNEAIDVFENFYTIYMDNGYPLPSEDEVPDIDFNSNIGEKYMDSIIDSLVTITDAIRTDHCNLNDFEAGFSIDLDIYFNINGVEFVANTCARYGEDIDGETPYVNVIIRKNGTEVSFITDNFDLQFDHEDGYYTTAEIKSSNNVIATDFSSILPATGEIRYNILAEHNINLKSLGKFILNRVYKEIDIVLNDITAGND